MVPIIKDMTKSWQGLQGFKVLQDGESKRTTEISSSFFGRPESTSY